MNNDITTAINKVTIEKGEDKSIEVLFWDKTKKRNFDLSSYDYFEFHFNRDDGSVLVKNSIEQAAKVASADVGGAIFTADNAGILGNQIELVFDGVADLDTVVGVWNTSNPLNTVSFTGISGTAVFIAQTFSLEGGYPATTYVTKETPNELGILFCTLTNEDTNSLKKGKDLGMRVILDSGAHPTGKRISKTMNLLDVLPSQF